jgi:hypothetical protein
MKYSNVVIANNVIMNNTLFSEVNAFGGGICLDWGSYALIANNLIAFNEVIGEVGSYGGGIGMLDGNATMYNNTLYENSAFYGPEISAWNYDISVIQNSIIWNRDLDPISGDPKYLVINFSDVVGGWPGVQNIDAYPQFVDPEKGDFHLKQRPCQPGFQSPCVDVGSDPAVYLGFHKSSTRTDSVPDQDMVDLGFHYGPYDP